MKKSIKLVAFLVLVALATSALLAFASCTPQTEELPQATGLKYIKTIWNDQDCYFVTGIGTETRTAFSVPQTHEGLPVCGIAQSAFYGNKTIEEIVLPQSVQYVAAMAFSYCSVKKITALGVTQIMQGAFAGSELQSAVLKANGEVKWNRYYASMQSDAYMSEFGAKNFEHNAYVLTTQSQSEFHYGEKRNNH